MGFSSNVSGTIAQSSLKEKAPAAAEHMQEMYQMRAQLTVN
jgi:hypothetical protein